MHKVKQGNNMKWIKSSESLPKEGQTVISSSGYLLHVKNGKWTDGKFEYSESLVKYWIPLPELPKE
jgi:hypothetical protein